MLESVLVKLVSSVPRPPAARRAQARRPETPRSALPRETSSCMQHQQVAAGQVRMRACHGWPALVVHLVLQLSTTSCTGAASPQGNRSLFPPVRT